MTIERLVHIVDDEAPMRDSLAFLLETSGLVAKSYASAEEFLDALPHVSSGCVVTDIRMPGMDGLELLRQLRARAALLPVVVMTGHGDVPLAVEAMKLGAVDFIEKPFGDETILAAIKGALARSGSPDAAAIKAFLAHLQTLTQRERQVFDRLVLGEANKVIARILEISPRTVEIYRANVMAKMQAANVSDLVRMAVRSGLA